MTTTMQRVRAWQGPAILSYGFRPFFFGTALWALIAMTIWLGVLSGLWSAGLASDPVAWHAHEFLYGYLGCVVAGFLLTSVPNWTGRLPIVGRPLGALAALWFAGRVAMGLSGALPALAVAIIDLLFPVALAVVIGREIAAGRNWRNLPVLGILVVLILGNGIFHLEAAQGGRAAGGFGLRLGLAAGVMLIALIGGRIVPSFTRNWLVKQGQTRLPAPPMGAFDRVALAALLAALALWVARPEATASGWALVVAGLLHLARLSRWAGGRTWAEPLVAVLHGGYIFVPLGALALGTAILAPDILPIAAAQHVWMAGAIGLMTLAVMTRATLGHSGQPLTAGPGTGAIYLAMIGAALLRLLAGLAPATAQGLHVASGLAWLAAFAGFLMLYGPLLMRRRTDN